MIDNIQRLKIYWLLSRPKKKGVTISLVPLQMLLFHNNSIDNIHLLGEELNLLREYFEVIIQFDLIILDQIIKETREDFEYFENQEDRSRLMTLDFYREKKTIPFSIKSFKEILFICDFDLIKSLKFEPKNEDSLLFVRKYLKSFLAKFSKKKEIKNYLEKIKTSIKTEGNYFSRIVLGVNYAETIDDSNRIIGSFLIAEQRKFINIKNFYGFEGPDKISEFVVNCCSIKNKKLLSPVRKIELSINNALLKINGTERLFSFYIKRGNGFSGEETRVFRIFLQLWENRTEFAGIKKTKTGNNISLEYLLKGNKITISALKKNIVRLQKKFNDENIPIKITANSEFCSLKVLYQKK